MKLLNRTNYILITTILFIFFIGSIIFYLLLKNTTEKENLAELESRLLAVQTEILEEKETFPELSISGYIRVKHIPEYGMSADRICDTLLFDAELQNYQLFKVLISEYYAHEQCYRIELYKSLTESNDLIEKIILVVTIILLVFIIFTYLLNKYMFERIWSDFFSTIDKLENYDINTGSKIHFDESEIAEFDLLNKSMNKMSAKIQRDYQDINEFTANISHEIQTPLSIIRQKAETLLQTQPLDKEQLTLIGDIQHTTSRLSRLNKTLILLTRIENKQFDRQQKLHVNNLLMDHIEVFKPIIEEKNITLDYNLKDTLVEADPVLIDILLVNLVKNAISYNIEEGSLSIHLDNNKLLISNTSEAAALNTTKIFKRHASFSGRKDALGLGLSLVKRICTLYEYDLIYFYDDDQHHFSITFASPVQEKK